MYFKNGDHCELCVRWALQREHPKAWREVLGALHVLTATDYRDSFVTSEEEFEGVLIEALAECVLYNSDEEPEPVYRRYGEPDPDSWEWAREDEMADSMGYTA